MINDDFRAKAEWREIHQLIANDPAARPGAVARKTLEKFGESEAEINEILFSEEEMAQQAQMAMQMQMDEQAKADGQQQFDNQIAMQKARPKEQPTAGKPKG